MEEPGAYDHQDMVGGSGSDNNNICEARIQAIMYAVEDLLLVNAKRVSSSFLLISPMPEPEGPSPMTERRNIHQNVLLLVIAVYFVASMTLLGLAGKLIHREISIPCIALSPTTYWPKLQLTLRPTPGLTLRPTIKPAPILTACLTHTPILQLVVDNIKDGVPIWE